jgi:hypothetical protein
MALRGFVLLGTPFLFAAFVVLLPNFQRRWSIQAVLRVELIVLTVFLGGAFLAALPLMGTKLNELSVRNSTERTVSIAVDGAAFTELPPGTDSALQGDQLDGLTIALGAGDESMQIVFDEANGYSLDGVIELSEWDRDNE